MSEGARITVCCRRCGLKRLRQHRADHNYGACPQCHPSIGTPAVVSTPVAVPMAELVPLLRSKHYQARDQIQHFRAHRPATSRMGISKVDGK
jgi:hypothetical protein